MESADSCIRGSQAATFWKDTLKRVKPQDSLVGFGLMSCFTKDTSRTSYRMGMELKCMGFTQETGLKLASGRMGFS